MAEDSLRRWHWFHLVVLLGLLLIGGAMRWSRIARESLSLDECWALYLATGRGGEVFQIPYNVIVESPPKVGFAGAPAWWHIWTGLSSTTHPPLYHLMLRAWVDLFGPGDLAIRAMSWLVGLGAAAALFDMTRRIAGAWRGLAAAAMMIFAPAQIDFSQIARPYTMMIFFGAILCDALIAVRKGKPSAAKLLVIAAATAALMLTHYFSAGAVVGAGIYAIVSLRGRSRKAVVWAMAAGLLVAAATWGPVFWETRHLYDAYRGFWKDPNSGIGRSLQEIVKIPIRLLLDTSDNWPWFAAIPLAALVYLVPPLLARRRGEMLLWWLWIIGTIGAVAAVDAVHHSTMVGVLRYAFLASPAVYAILATAVPGRAGAAVAGIMAICAAVYGVSRVQEGPEPAEDWRTMAHLIDRSAGPHDVIALLGYYKTEQAFDYFVIAHYIGDWTRPVIFVSQPPDDRLRAELARRRVWMVGHSPLVDTRRLLGDWGFASIHGVGRRNAVWLLAPPARRDGSK
jgi:Dolichyl-phosphate-mannose-protein mannosyltransferase